MTTTTSPMARPPVAVSVRSTMADQATNPDLPAWHRAGCLAWSLADQTGHARLATGHLRRALGLTAQQTSEALALARRRGWLDPCSTARCIVLPGYGVNSCDETHRDVSMECTRCTRALHVEACGHVVCRACGHTCDQPTLL